MKNARRSQRIAEKKNFSVQEKKQTTQTYTSERDSIINDVVDMIVGPVVREKAMKALGVTPSTAALFYGPPGTGKTTAVKEIKNRSEELLGCPVRIVTVECASVLSKWVGESEKQITALFDTEHEEGIEILFFDELDALAPIRGDTTRNFNYASILSTMLIKLDQIAIDRRNNPKKSKFVIGATNIIDAIDPALIRSGRFRRFFEFKPLQKTDVFEAIQSMTKTWCMSLKVTSSIAQIISGQVAHVSGAFVKDVCDTVGEMLALESSKMKDAYSLTRDDKKMISYFSLAIQKKTGSSYDVKVLTFYNRYISKCVDEVSQIMLMTSECARNKRVFLFDITHQPAKTEENPMETIVMDVISSLVNKVCVSMKLVQYDVNGMIDAGVIGNESDKIRKGGLESGALLLIKTPDKIDRSSAEKITMFIWSALNAFFSARVLIIFYGRKNPKTDGSKGLKSEVEKKIKEKTNTITKTVKLDLIIKRSIALELCSLKDLLLQRISESFDVEETTTQQPYVFEQPIEESSSERDVALKTKRGNVRRIEKFVILIGKVLKSSQFTELNEYVERCAPKLHEKMTSDINNFLRILSHHKKLPSSTIEYKEWKSVSEFLEIITAIFYDPLHISNEFNVSMLQSFIAYEMACNFKSHMESVVSKEIKKIKEVSCSEAGRRKRTTTDDIIKELVSTELLTPQKKKALAIVVKNIKDSIIKIYDYVKNEECLFASISKVKGFETIRSMVDNAACSDEKLANARKILEYVSTMT